MILQPQEYFSIVRQLPDPTDSTTYYVRAVVRNARTDALIETVNLTDRGNRRFSQPWQTPADSSGMGFYISVCTSVYTDAAYTTKSDNYAEEMQTYLIDNRFRNLGGGGGGSDVDYKKLREIFKEVLTAFDWSKVFSLSPVLEAFKALGLSKLGQWISRSSDKLDAIEVKIDGVKASVLAIDIPEAVDLAPVLKAIADKEVTELPDPVDLTPVLDAITSLHEVLNTDDIKKIIDSLPEVSKNAVELESKIKDLVFVIGKQAPQIEKQLKDFFYTLQTEGGSLKPKTPEVPKPDYNAMGKDLVGLK